MTADAGRRPSTDARARCRRLARRRAAGDRCCSSSTCVVLVADLRRRGDRLGWRPSRGLVAAALALLRAAARRPRAHVLPAGATRRCLRARTSPTASPWSFQVLVLGGAAGRRRCSSLDDRRATTATRRGEYCFLLLCLGHRRAGPGRRAATCSRWSSRWRSLSLPAFALVGAAPRRRRAAEAALTFFLVVGRLHRRDAARASASSTAPPARCTSTGSPTALGRRRPAGSRRRGSAWCSTLVGFALQGGRGAVPLLGARTPTTGAPLPVAAYLSIVSKAAGFAGLVAAARPSAFPPYADVWGPVLAVLAALTMTVGNLRRAAAARSAVRLLAWSSVAQAGYILVPLRLGRGRADVERRAAGATVAYLLSTRVDEPRRVRRGRRSSAGTGRPTARRTTAALGAPSPLTALALAFFLLCLAGLPPGLLGLFAKVVVFRRAGRRGAWAGSRSSWPSTS